MVLSVYTRHSTNCKFKRDRLSRRCSCPKWAGGQLDKEYFRNQLNGIFAGTNAYWYAAGSISQPIFEGGRLRSQYHYSQAQQQEMVAQYQKTILNALKEVSNSLTAYKETANRREEQTSVVVSATDAVRLARLRYAGGNTSYLEVLTTDTDLYDAQLRLAQTQEDEANSIVQLYTALGGGWK